MPYTRLTAVWTGVAGMPGYTRIKFAGTLDASGAATAAARVRSFFNGFPTLLPTGISITMDGVAQQFDDNQQLTGEVSYVPPAAVTGSGTGAWAAPVGMVVNWLTDTFHNGRRLRGRTFIVPMIGSAFEANGTPSSTTVGSLTTAANTLMTGTPSLVIAGGNATTGFYSAPVTGGNVPDRAVVLRSRRD